MYYVSSRVSFEQDALPRLLFLQGIVPVFTLPGDRMFQATGLCHNKQRPPIMHAYGRAKTRMAQALQSIASEGWTPMAAAIVGAVGKKPMWADLDLFFSHSDPPHQFFCVASKLPSRSFFLLRRCLDMFRAVRFSVSKAKETAGMYNGPLNMIPKQIKHQIKHRETN